MKKLLRSAEKSSKPLVYGLVLCYAYCMKRTYVGSTRKCIDVCYICILDPVFT